VVTTEPPAQVASKMRFPRSWEPSSHCRPLCYSSWTTHC